MIRLLRPSWALIGVLALAVAFALFAAPERASAHAVLERSLPVQGQKLEEPPELIETWYSEALERSLTELKVLDTGGEPVHAGKTIFSESDPLYAAVEVPPDLQPGIYTVTYENVSQVDGHVWSGFFSFIILEPDGSVPEGEAVVPGGLAAGEGFLPEVSDTVLRWVGLVAASLLGGGIFFVLAVARPAAEFLGTDRRRGVEASSVIVLAATVIVAAAAIAVSSSGQVLVLADRLGSGLEGLGDILFGTRSGELALSRMGLSIALGLLFLPVMVSEAVRSSRQAVLVLYPALIGAAGLLMTYSLASHAAAEEGGAFWGVSADFVHFVATAAWLGAVLQLPLLFWWSRGRLEEPQRSIYLASALDRFSWVAVVGVTLLIGTGVFNGFVQLPTMESLWDTTYGRVLIAKLSLIIPLLGIAAVNAWFLKPRLVEAIDALHADDPQLRASGRERRQFEGRMERLRWALPRTTVTEFVLGVAVLVSVSILAQSTTAAGDLRVQAAQSTEDFTAVEQTETLEVDLTISPFTIGLNEYIVELTAKEGHELGEVLGVRLTATFDDPSVPPSAGRQGTQQELEPTDQRGVWSTEAALLTQPGDWQVETRIQRRGFDDQQVRFAVQEVGGFLAREETPEGLFDLPFTFVDWNIVAGGAMVALGVGAFAVWHNRPPSWRRVATASTGFGGAFALIAGSVLLFGVHAHEFEVPSSSPVEASPDSIARGQELFERNCVQCHGPEGEGDGPAAENLDIKPPRLGDHVPFHNDGVLFTWVTEGIPIDSEQKNMPSFKNLLSEQDRWHLINFLRATFDTGEFEPVLPEDLATPVPDGGSPTP